MTLLPTHYLKSVVALGVPSDNEEGRVWIASGFHYFHRMPDEDGEKRYQPFLVTNRHVVDREDPLYVRVNPLATGAARQYEVSGHWVAHPDPGIDVAVTPVNASLLVSDELDVYFFQSDTDCASVDVMKGLHVSEGDFVYTLGFPMGLVGAERDAVIVRNGSIARVQDLLDGEVNSFILDAAVFPGNSGGPVVLMPQIAALPTSAPVSTAYVIGIVAGFLPYLDVAVSQQSGRPRVSFEENSGLALAFPMDAVSQAADLALSQATPIEAEPQQSEEEDR